MIFCKKVSQTENSQVYVFCQGRYLLMFILLPLIFLLIPIITEFGAGLLFMIFLLVLIIEVTPLYITMLIIPFKASKIKLISEFEGKKKFLFGTTRFTLSWE